ncbi:MAG TPA: hypothetical protein VFN21_13580, partial [Acidimicrobiales bacterium]|nr:hypothetical protein [Acidimicrobiales bacterium]
MTNATTRQMRTLAGPNSVGPLLAARVVAAAFVLVLSMVPMLVRADPASAKPAPVAQAPGCPGEYSALPGYDLCPEFESFTLESTGALGNGGANVQMTSAIPPCASQHSATDEYSPSGCYSSVRFDLDPDM